MRQYIYKSKPGLLRAPWYIKGMVTQLVLRSGPLFVTNETKGSMLKKKEKRHNSNQIRFLIPMQMLPEPRACRVEVVSGGLGQSFDY